ncbi:MAG: putative ribosome biogenesis GTPase RsgA [Candidatus Anoxychlamydiales bacterium]|nr:putative ribosome biogenesis GTPase RsgA [Candidatus Anoxychlamydiales bacterium]
MIDKFDKYLEEEEHFLKDSKKYRKQRKLKSSKDRSKYKKTDIQKTKILSSPKNASKKHLDKAVVLSILGSEIIVSFNKKEYRTTLRGILKKEKTKNKNILAVGDIVNISFKNEKEASIESIEKRYSILSRQDERTKKRSIIAVNIDQVLITSSVGKPHLKPFLIDRYLIACIKGNMSPVIVINKIDLLKPFTEEEEKYKKFLKIYEELGYLILSISCKTKDGLDSLLNVMKGKTSVFSGQSGCGKTTLINEVLNTKFKTGKLAKKTYKGAHVTTKSQLIEIKKGGFCVDTPGIKGFGIWDLEIEDLKNHFFEFDNFAKNCKFEDCKHINEPSCKVKEAIEKNKISFLRFEAYRSLMKEILEKKGKLYE